MGIEKEDLYRRISDAPWYGYQSDICIGGAGGLGSWIAMNLGRIGHDLTVYDMDTVDSANLGGGQFYAEDQVGEPKTLALKKNIWRFSGSNQFTGLSRFEKGMMVQPITITTFDNMESRMDMFQEWLKLAKAKPKDSKTIYCFINVSMLAEGGFIEVVDRPSRTQRWLDDWKPSDQIEDLPCSFKSTTHNASLMANMAVGLLNNVIFNSIKDLKDFRATPYKTEVDLNLFRFDFND